MKWTTDKPTVPGWYWCRTSHFSAIYHFDGKDWWYGRMRLSLDIVSEWQGPITPEEGQA